MESYYLIMSLSGDIEISGGCAYRLNLAEMCVETFSFYLDKYCVMRVTSGQVAKAYFLLAGMLI